MDREQPEKKTAYPWEKVYPVDVDWNQKIEPKSMVEFFDKSISKHNNKTFVSFMGKKYSYKKIGEMVDKAAKGFQDMGVKKGSKVALCLPNSPFYVVSYFGALKAGATVVNINPTYPEEKIEHFIKDSDAEVLVTLDMGSIYPKMGAMLDKGHKLKKVVTCSLGDNLPTTKKILFGIKNIIDKEFKGKKLPIEKQKWSAKIPNDGRHIDFFKMLKNKGNPEPVQIDPENDVAVLQYTGGTTGLPKAAMLTHANIYTNTKQVDEWFSMAREDNIDQHKMLAVLPFFHVFAMTAEMNFSMSIGAELDMMPTFNLEDTLKAIDEGEHTIFAGVPAIYKAMMDTVEKYPGRYNLTSLRLSISGGAPLDDEIKTKFEQNTRSILFEGYGLSETSPVVVANPFTGVQKKNSIGLPMPDTIVSIRDMDFPDKTVPINVKGEIALRGPQVMKGYWKNDKATEETMTEDGFFLTGDLGHMDEDGFTYITGRKKDMIITQGNNVYPINVEKAIMKHNAVAECFVAGLPDDKRGETVKAYIVLKPNATLSQTELHSFLKEKLSGPERPRMVEFFDSFPKTLKGEPDKKILVEIDKNKIAEAKKLKNSNDNAIPKKAIKRQGPN